MMDKLRYQEDSLFIAVFETPDRKLKRIVTFELKKNGNWEECIV